MDVDLTNPEITLIINRQRAMIEGISTQQIGQQIRTALFGRELSKIKDNKDEFKIQLRNQELQRKSLTDLLNMKIVFRDISSGQVKQIPISNLVTLDYTSTYGSIKRKALKRVITLYSSVLTGYTPTDVNASLKQSIDAFQHKADDVTITQTGEGKQQQETGFLPGQRIDYRPDADPVHPGAPIQFHQQTCDHSYGNYIQHHRRTARIRDNRYGNFGSDDRTWCGGLGGYCCKERNSRD